MKPERQKQGPECDVPSELVGKEHRKSEKEFAGRKPVERKEIPVLEDGHGREGQVGR